MADMIDAKEAKEILGCDDATLQNHINQGGLKAQRVGGKLMLDKNDVLRMKGGVGGDEDGTIVLTGDSENLQIDLGKVVDDSSETIVQPQAAKKSSNESITFGEELEVVNFDDQQKTQATEAGTKKDGLSFTESNTAVVTSVEETQVGGTTAPLDFQTSAADSPNDALPGAEAGRRSVRSNRSKVEEVKVHWLWLACLILTVFVGLAFVAPFYVIGSWPHGEGEKDHYGATKRGLDDNGWTNFAGSVAGFAVEPDQDQYKRTHGDTQGWIDIKAAGKDQNAEWRFRKYQGEFKGQGERLETFLIDSIEVKEGAVTAKSKGDKKSYVGSETTNKLDNGQEVKELAFTVWDAK